MTDEPYTTEEPPEALRAELLALQAFEYLTERLTGHSDWPDHEQFYLALIEDNEPDGRERALADLWAAMMFAQAPDFALAVARGVFALEAGRESIAREMFLPDETKRRQRRLTAATARAGSTMGD